MYQLHTHKGVRKDLRRLSPDAAHIIVHEYFGNLCIDPYQGQFLKGHLRNLRKLVCSVRGVAYRVIYLIDEKTHTILVIAVGSREGFYDRLLRRIN